MGTTQTFTPADRQVWTDGTLIAVVMVISGVVGVSVMRYHPTRGYILRSTATVESLQGWRVVLCEYGNTPATWVTESGELLCTDTVVDHYGSVGRAQTECGVRPVTVRAVREFVGSPIG